MNIDDLESSIIISLKTKIRKEGDIESGWWGDQLLGFELGSEIHTLSRSPLTNETLEKTKIFTEEALKNVLAKYKVHCFRDNQRIKTKVEVEGESFSA